MRFSRKFGLLKVSCCMVFANVTIAPCTDSDFHMTYNTFCDSGVHRSMGTHISKVRSIELDQHIWTVTLIEVCCLHGMYVNTKQQMYYCNTHYYGCEKPLHFKCQFSDCGCT